MQPWEKDVMHVVGDPAGSYDASSENPANDSGALTYAAMNLLGGLAPVFGGGLDYAGTLLKTMDEKGRESSLVDSIKNGGQGALGNAGDWIINNGEYLNNIGDDINQRYKNHAWDNKSITDRLTSLDYLTDKGGFLADVTNGIGSSIPFMAGTALTPEITLPARGVGLLSSILGRVGAKRLASAIGPTVEKAAVDGVEQAVTKPSWAMSVANDFGNYALKAGPMEALTNAGGNYSAYKDMGLSSSEMLQRMNDMATEELPMDMATSGIFGSVLGGKTFSRLGKGGLPRAVAANALNVPMEMASEAVQEMGQQRIQNKYAGKEYGTWLNPTEDELEAGRLAAIGALPMALLGFGRGTLASRQMARQGASDTQGAPIIQNPAPTPGLQQGQPDITAENPQQYAQDYSAWLDTKLGDMGINIPQMQTPRAEQGGAQATQQSAAASVPTYDTKAYDITGEVSDTALDDDTEARLNALAHEYQAKFGEPLQVTSMKRNGNGSSWHDSGQAFDIAGGKLETNENGEREWLMQRGQELGLTPLDEYANPSAHATGGHIHFSNHEDGSAPAIGEGSAQGGAADDVSSLPYGNIANAISKRTGIPAKFIWAQMAWETGDFKSNLSVNDHNYGGIKKTDGSGEFRHFDSDEEYIDYAAKNLQAYAEDGILNAKNIDEYAAALKKGGYFEDNLGHYTEGLKAKLSDAGLSEVGSAQAAQKLQAPQMLDLMGQKLLDFADADTKDIEEAYSHILDGVDTTTQGKFLPGMFDPSGKFVNTKEHRAAIAQDDGMSAVLLDLIATKAPTLDPALKEMAKTGSISLADVRRILAPKAEKAKPVEMQHAPKAGKPATQARGTQNAGNPFAILTRAIEQKHLPQDDPRVKQAQAIQQDPLPYIVDHIASTAKGEEGAKDIAFLQTLQGNRKSIPYTPQTRAAIAQHFGEGRLMGELHTILANTYGLTDTDFTNAAQSLQAEQRGPQTNAQESPAPNVQQSTNGPQVNPTPVPTPAEVNAAPEANAQNPAPQVQQNPTTQQTTAPVPTPAETSAAPTVQPQPTPAPQAHGPVLDTETPQQNVGPQPVPQAAPAAQETPAPQAQPTQAAAGTPQEDLASAMQETPSKRFDPNLGAWVLKDSDKGQAAPYQEAPITTPAARPQAPATTVTPDMVATEAQQAAEAQKVAQKAKVINAQELQARTAELNAMKPSERRAAGAAITETAEAAGVELPTKDVKGIEKNNAAAIAHAEKEVERASENQENADTQKRPESAASENQDAEPEPRHAAEPREESEAGEVTAEDGGRGNSAQKEEKPKATGKEALKELPDEAIIAVKEYYPNYPSMNMFTEEERDILRRAGVTRMEEQEDGDMAEVAIPEPILEEGDRRYKEDSERRKAEEEKRKQTEAKNTQAVGAPVAGKTGSTVTVETDKGKKLTARYRLVPQEKLVTSNVYDNDVIVENHAYPQDVQPRDRTSRKDLRAQTDKIATQMEPEKLGASLNLNQGAPIIRSDGVVLNGNGRTMGIRRAHELKNESAKRYDKWLLDNAESFGFSKDAVRDLLHGSSHPILVREIEDVTGDTLQDVINSTTGGARMGAAELAASDAARITARDFADYDAESEGDLTKASNDTFVAKLLRKLANENDINAYVDKNGAVSADGYQRVKRAIFSVAYKDAALIAKMAESTDDAIRNISNGLQAAAANIARLNLKMQDGHAYKYPLSATIARAVKKYNAIKEGTADEKDVASYVEENKNVLLGGGDPAEVVELVKAFDAYRRSGKKVGTLLNNVAHIIDGMGSPEEDATALDFGIANQRPNLPEVFTMVRKEIDNDGSIPVSQPSGTAESSSEHDGSAEEVRGSDRAGAPANDAGEVPENHQARVQAADARRNGSVSKGKKNAKQQQKQEPQENKVFKGTDEDADAAIASVLKELGIKKTAPKEKELPKIVDVFDESEAHKKELREKLKKAKRKMGANLIFDPDFFLPALELGGIYIQEHINDAAYRFQEWARDMRRELGESEDTNAWLGAIHETLASWPNGEKFNETIMTQLVKGVGIRYEKGDTHDEIIERFTEDMSNSNKKRFTAMLDAAYNGVDRFFHPTEAKEETANAHDGTNGLVERAGTGQHQDDVGRADESGEPRTGSKREGVREVGTESRPFGSIRVRDGSAAPRGEIGDRGVQAGEPVDSSGRAGNPELPGGVKSSLDGSSELDRAGQENPAPSAQERHLDAATEKVTAANEKTKKPHTAQVKTADLAQIKDDCPSLQDAQAEDVVFGETRLFDKGGTGVMFTNGTGTGKTFTGMGLVKRMILRGKKNILIVSPTGEINKSWVETAKKYFGVDIHVLKDTNDAGKDGEVCVTTYANFQQNDALVHDRDWDAVIADESHNIMNNANGEDTGILKMLRAVTLHARGLKDRLELKYRTKQMEGLQKTMADLTKQIKAAKKGKGGDAKQLEAAYRDAEAKYYTELGKIRESHKDVMEKWEALPKEQKPKVIFLSATPFAYDKDVDYAEGYLFDYPPAGEGYNSGSGRDRFMMQHFGYRMRYNKLTRPDGKVDNRAMEVQFYDTLVHEGVLHGRQLEVDADYDRGFLLVDQGIGAKIDEGFHILWDDKRFHELGEFLRKQFDRRTQRYLLESIKAKSAVKLARQYEKMGRKVVIFHQAMVEHDNIHPFYLDTSKLSGSAEVTQKIREQYETFAAEHPDLVHLNIGDEPSPMETFRDGFGDDALYIDGSAEHKKGRKDAVKQFNDDTSGKNIIIVQQDAGNAGISLHDLTGKHPRVLLNIALPERPSYAMQIEGRIYRVGNASNAVFRYLATGTDLEKSLFASTIGGRAETVENLALGAKARGLRDSFTTLYQEVLNGDWKRRLPGHEEEGTGGKEMDRAIGGDLSDYERAKSFYFARGKKTAKNKAAEGTDYFATPEPIGLKMVEWLGQKIGDRFLEPSAGHGAISRWSSPNAQNTIVEPSGKLAPEAQLVTPDAKVVRGRFEDLDLHNKYDGIAMNPPFGQGGKTAVEHIAKAYKHLSDGGRLVAILPDGPAANKRFHAWLYGETPDGTPIKSAKPPADAVLVADLKMPGVMFERAGTSVRTRIVIIDKYANESDREEAHANARGETDFSDAKDINELFDRMEDLAMPKRIGEDRAQNFTLGKANPRKRTSLPYEANIEDDDTLRDRALYNTELQKLANKYHGGFLFTRKTFAFKTSEDANAFMKDADRYIDEHKAEFFDEETAQEASVQEPAPQEAPAEEAVEATEAAETQDDVTRVKDGKPLIDTSDYTHTKTGEKMLAVKINTKLGDEAYKKVKGYAKAYGGYYNRYARRFIFEDENGRNQFAMNAYGVAYDEAYDNDDLAETRYSIGRGDAAQTKAQTKADLDDAIQKALPGASKSEYHTETTANGSRQGVVTFNLANGMPVEIRTVDKITPSTSERARAKREHGMEEDEAATINGYVDTETETTISVNGHTATKSSMARIVLSRVANFTDTLYHEVFHVAYDLFLTKKEKAAIEHAYGEKAAKAGMTIEEYAADRYRDWAKAKLKGLHTSYGKIWQKVSDGAEKTSELMVETEEVARIFDSIESGEMFERHLDMETRERDNEGGTRAKEAERVKTALLDGITKSVSDKFMEKISELNSEASVKNILHDHASKLKEKVLAGINRQVNRFRTNDIYEMRERIADIMANGEHDEDAKRQIREIVAKASADDIRLAYSQYRNMMEEVQDYAGIAFEELAHGRKNSERFDGLLRAEDVERSNRSHGGAFNLQEIIRGNQLNNESRSGNQDGFSDAENLMPGPRRKTHYSIAYHGTQHEFDKFDIGAIGTGEGSQAHGWGLYFAKDRKVSERYQSILTGGSYVSIGGEKYKLQYDRVVDSHGKSIYDNIDAYKENDVISAVVIKLLDNHGNKEKAIAELKRSAARIRKNLRKKEAYLKAIDVIEKDDTVMAQDGMLAEVEIPEDDVMLDEQKPFDEQPEKVRKALESLGADTKGDGEQIYESLSKKLGSDREASLALNDAGIQGIKYNGYRDGDCYVVFDDKAVSIIRKLSATRADAAHARAVSDIKREILRAFPGAKDIRDAGDRMTFTMPNGAKVEIRLKNSMHITPEQAAKERKARGYAEDVVISVNGSEVTLGGKAFIELSKAGKKGTIYHEALHAAIDLCLTKKQKDALYKRYGGDEERMADAYRDYMLGKTHDMGLLWRAVHAIAKNIGDAIFALREGLEAARTARTAFEQLSTGEAWLQTAKSSNAQHHSVSRSDTQSGFSNARKSDAEYMEAVERYQHAATDSERAQALSDLQGMVQEAAENAGFLDAIPEQTTAYHLRTGKAPQKTLKVYKVFTVAPDGAPTALFVSGTAKLPQGVWLDAQAAYHFTADNGKEYVPSTQNPYTKGGKTGKTVPIPSEEVREELIARGFLKPGSTAKNITALAYRPGWHAGTLPFFPQGGKKNAAANYGMMHRANQVVFECELAADKDYTQEARSQAKAFTKDGRPNPKNADLQYMPENGFYYYATNPLTQSHPELGAWAISGSLKINRALTQEECDRILEKNGMKPQAWEQGTLNLAGLGYTGEQNDAARKTLAPITYDDAGEVIPLSERFNAEKADVRYSVTEAEQSAKGFVRTQSEKFLHKLGLKSEKVLTDEEQQNPNHKIGLLQKTVLSPHVVADKLVLFRPLYQMATRAMDVLVHERNRYNQKLDQALSLVKGKEKDDLYARLLQGDAEGKEWTRQELIDDGASENVADAYIQIRRLMTKAYHMVNNARRHPEPKTKTVTRSELDALKANHFVTSIDGVEDLGNGRYRVSYKEARHYNSVYRDVTDDAIKTYESDPRMEVLEAKANGRTDLDGKPLYDVTVMEGPADLTKLKGYIPHFFHEYMLRVVKDDGSSYVVGSGRTQREAVKNGEAYLKTHQLPAGATLHVQPKVFDFSRVGMSEKEYAPIMGDRDFYGMVSNLAKQNNMTIAEARDMLDGNVRLKGRHRFFGNALHRTGAEGYETNLDWVLRHYFNSAARYAAMETEFKPKAISYFERMFGKFDDDHADNALARFAKDYINDINGNPNSIEQTINDVLKSSAFYRNVIVPTFGDRAALTLGNAISRKVSYLTLGFNMSSALLNLTQLINAAAYLGDPRLIGKMMWQGKRHRKSIVQLRKEQARATTQAEKDRIQKEIGKRMKELRILHETGVFSDIGLDSGSGYDQMRSRAASFGHSRIGRAFAMANNTMDFIGNKSMLMFREMDAICRRGTVLAAYEKAIAEGKTHAQAIAYARDVNLKANFEYGVQDAANAFRYGSILSQLALQFKKYGFKELEVMADFAPLSKKTTLAQKAMFWGMYLAICGVMGIPALDWLDEVLGNDKRGYPKDAIQKWVIGHFPKRVAAAILYGLPALADINLSSRAGLADVIPTQGINFLGPTISKAVNLKRDAWDNGDFASSLRDISPGAYNLYAAYTGESRGKRGRLEGRYDSAWDRLLRAIGFRSVSESAPVDMQRIITHDKAALTSEKQKAQDDYIKDPTSENAQRLKDLGISPKTIGKEAEKKEQTREERMEGSVKKQKERYQDLLNFAQ